MFAQMRAALSIPKTTDILTHIYSLPAPDQEPAMESIRAIESQAMTAQKPQPGLLELMRYLEGRGMRKGICTRNFEYVFLSFTLSPRLLYSLHNARGGDFHFFEIRSE
ncbi:hypothetical protein MMC24_001904 [Lignoscripta atroalba]|nr:hypothetical protein [Lignoscripta atroalba]